MIPTAVTSHSTQVDKTSHWPLYRDTALFVGMSYCGLYGFLCFGRWLQHDQEWNWKVSFLDNNDYFK